MSCSRIARCIGFTGQGSQWVGMGKSLVEQFPKTRWILEEVNSVIGASLSEIMFSGPEVRFLESEFIAKEDITKHSL